MSKGRLARGLWPAHLKPKEDELLSSWLTRLAIAHDFTPDNFCSLVWPSSHLFNNANVPEGMKKRLRSHFFSDVDLITEPTILEVLVEGTGTPIDRVVATTLSAYADYFYDDYWDLSYSWITRVDLIPRKKIFGLQFCPECLLTDAEPYYRRRWRLSFLTHCERHCTPLLDSCLRCGSCKPLMFKKQPHRHILLTRCSSCQADLRTTPSDPALSKVDAEELKFEENLMKAFHQGWVNVHGSGYVNSHLYFKALHMLAKLLSVGQDAAFYRDSASVYFDVPLVTVSPHKPVERFEKLRISERRGVLGLVRLLLQDWPNAITDFLVWLGHAPRRAPFTKDGKTGVIPFWFWSVVRDYIVEQKYRESFEEFEARLEYKFKAANTTRVRRSSSRSARNRFAGTKILSLLGARAALSYSRRATTGVNIDIEPLGVNIDIESLTALLTNHRSIRDAILFPRIRPRQAAEESPQSVEN